MGIGTLLSGGLVKCDNCGDVVKDNRGKDALNNSGLGILRDIANASKKNFCSDKCKREWEAAHGKGASSSDSSESSGSSGMSKAEIKLEQKKLEMQEMENWDKEDAEEEAKEKAEKDDIVNVKFGDSADDISEKINDLFAKAASLAAGFVAGNHEKQMRLTIAEKIEFGIMKLRKQDADMADFFQKKLDEFKKKNKIK